MRSDGKEEGSHMDDVEWGGKEGRGHCRILQSETAKRVCVWLEFVLDPAYLPQLVSLPCAQSAEAAEQQRFSVGPATTSSHLRC